MKTISTVNSLEVLLHCHVSNSPHPRAEAPAVKEAIRALSFEGMIEPFDRHHVTTDKGTFYIKHLLKQPFPVVAFSIPEV